MSPTPTLSATTVSCPLVPGHGRIPYLPRYEDVRAEFPTHERTPTHEEMLLELDHETWLEELDAKAANHRLQLLLAIHGLRDLPAVPKPRAVSGTSLCPCGHSVAKHGAKLGCRGDTAGGEAPCPCDYTQARARAAIRIANVTKEP